MRGVYPKSWAVFSSAMVLAAAACGDDEPERVDAGASDVGPSDTGAPKCAEEPEPWGDDRGFDLSLRNGAEPFRPDNGCLDSEFFVQVRDGFVPPEDGFVEAFEDQVRTWFRDHFCQLFVRGMADFGEYGCTWDADDCRYEPAERETVDVEVSGVFPRRSEGDCLVHDGHRRFFRVRLVYRGGPAEVPESAVCFVEEELIRIAGEVAGPNPSPPQLCNAGGSRWRGLTPSFEVGRDCRARPLKIPALPAAQLEALRITTWHRDLLQADTLPPNPTIPVANRPALYLVDTGVYPAVANGAAVDDPVSPGVVLDDHGSALALLARQMTPAGVTADPRTQVVSRRVTDDGFSIPTDELARALERLFWEGRSDSARSRVVNLSLGWPTRLTHPDVTRPVCGAVPVRYDPVAGVWIVEDQCVREEAPFGGAVEYALALLRFGAFGTTTVFASPGNTPGPYRREGVGPAERVRFEGGPNACRPPGMPRDLQDPLDTARALYYPAEWGRVDRDLIDPLTLATAANTRLAIPVGAIDDEGRRVATTLPARDVPMLFEAPGQQVYVGAIPRAADQVVPPISAPVCSSTGMLPNRYALPSPSPWTGTSVSTALTSAAAVEAAAEWAAAAASPNAPAGMPEVLGRIRLPALLKVTGTRDALTDEGGVAPSLCRVRAALQDCPDAVNACILSVSDTDPAAVLELIETTTACEPVLVCLDGSACGSPQKEPVRWPSPYNPGTTCSANRATTATNNRVCAASASCLVESASSGIGPQPGPDWCPECRLLVLDVEPPQWILTLEIAPDLDPATPITQPVLVADQGGNPLVFPLDENADWVPGATFEIEVTPPPGLASPDAAYVAMEMGQPGEESVTFMSPLRIEP